MTIKLDSLVDTQQENLDMRFLIMVCLEEEDGTLCGQGLIFRPVAQSDNSQEQIKNEHKRIGVFEYVVYGEDIPWWDAVDKITKAPCCKKQVLRII